MVEEKIRKSITSCQRALLEYQNGNKKMALGSLDYVQDRITAAKWLLISKIEEEENDG